MAVEVRARAGSRPYEAVRGPWASAGAGVAPWARRRVWRWLPWTAPRVRLSRPVRPLSRTELTACELFRCQPDWSAPALAARLARAPSTVDVAALGFASAGDPPRAIGWDGAWDLLDDWLERGVVKVVGA